MVAIYKIITNLSRQILDFFKATLILENKDKIYLSFRNWKDSSSKQISQVIMTQQVHLHLSSLDKMDSRNLEEQRLGGMGQCGKAVLKVLRSQTRKVVEKMRKKSYFNLFHT